MRRILFGTALAAMLASAAAPAQGSHPAFAPPAPAPDWRPLGQVRGITLTWNAAGVERGDTLIVPVRAMPPTPGNATYAYSITRVEMRCAPAEAHAIHTVNIRPDGSTGRIDDVPEPFEPIPPGSLFGLIHSALCPASATSAPQPH